MFNFITYMEDCATRLKDIGHTESAPRFFRINSIGHLDELLSSLSEAQYPAIMVQDNNDGNIGDQNISNNYLDSPNYVFYLVQHVSYEDHDARQAAKDNCKAIGLKIISKMKRDKMNGLQGLTFLDFTNIPYQSIGPIGDNCYGVMFSVTVPDGTLLTYNPDDWTD